MAVVFFEPAGPGLVTRVHKEGLGMHQQLLSLAELVQSICGIVLPVDPDRTAGDTELLLESYYMEKDLQRLRCTLEADAPEVHTNMLHDEVHAESAFFQETPQALRTKMVLARALQRNGLLNPDEDLKMAWSKTLAVLRGRAAHL